MSRAVHAVRSSTFGYVKSLFYTTCGLSRSRGRGEKSRKPAWLLKKRGFRGLQSACGERIMAPLAPVVGCIISTGGSRMTKDDFAAKLAKKTDLSKAKGARSNRLHFLDRFGAGHHRSRARCRPRFHGNRFRHVRDAASQGSPGPQPADGRDDSDSGHDRPHVQGGEGTQGPRPRLTLFFERGP